MDSLIEALNVYQTLLIKFAVISAQHPPSVQVTILNFLNPWIIEGVRVNPGQIVIIYRCWPSVLTRLYSTLIRTESLLLRPAIELSRRKFKNSNVAQPLARFIVSRK